jgi:hypothetical protein
MNRRAESALPPKADMQAGGLNVRLVPFADVTPLPRALIALWRRLHALTSLKASRRAADETSSWDVNHSLTQ